MSVPTSENALTAGTDHDIQITTLPAIHISNADFMRGIFPTFENGEYGWQCTFAPSPASKQASWGGQAFTDFNAVKDYPHGNGYFSVAVLKATGERKRRKDSFSRLPVIVADDFTGNASCTYRLQTSIGKCQVGWKLSEPIADVGVAERLHQALATMKLMPADSSGNNVVRYVRLPNQVNTKYEPAFAGVLDIWEPERTFTLEQVCNELGIDYESIANKPSKATESSYAGQTLSADTHVDDAELIRQFQTGETYHEPLNKLIARYASRGMDAGAIEQTVKGFMLACNDGSERWQSRFDDIGRSTKGAIEKFARKLAVEAREFHLIQVSDFADSTIDDEWFIDEVIPRARLGLVYGESGSGKSFFVIDVMIAIAQGKSWRGHAVQQGRVIYVAAEGAGGAKKRFKAIQTANKTDLKSLDILVLDQAPNLLSDDDVALAEVIANAGGAALIVIDTLAQTTPGANENSSEDMGAALARCKRLYEATGAMVILVHHSGKDSSRGARGWSGIKGALDVEIEISRSSGEYRTARITKQKDGGDNSTFSFVLEVIETGKSKNGKPITSCVVSHVDNYVRPQEPKGDWQKAVWDYVSDQSDTGRATIPVDEIVSHIKSKTIRTGDKVDRRRDSTVRAINSLAAAGFFSINDGNVVLSQTDIF